MADSAQCRLAIVHLSFDGWNVASIAGYLATTRPRVYEPLHRFFTDGFAEIPDKSHASNQPARKEDFRTMAAWIEARYSPTPNGMAIYLHDVTEEWIAEERLRLALESAAMGIWDWNVQNGVTIWSERMGPLFGLPAEPMCVSEEVFFAMIHREDLEGLQMMETREISTGSAHDTVYRVVWSDGAVHWIAAKGRSIQRDETGRVTRVLGVAMDITAHQTAELALQKQRSDTEPGSSNCRQSPMSRGQPRRMDLPMSARGLAPSWATHQKSGSRSHSGQGGFIPTIMNERSLLRPTPKPPGIR